MNKTHPSVRILYLFLFLILLVLPSINAVSPFLSIGGDESPPPITIVNPLFQNYDTHCNITLNFDVLDHNLTKMSSSDIDCEYSIVNSCGQSYQSGELNYSVALTYWYINLPNDIPEDVYNYYVYCNHTHVGGEQDGGYVSSGFVVRKGGPQLTSTTGSWLPLIIGLGIFALVSLVMSFNIQEPLLDGVKSFLFLLGLLDSFLLFVIMYLATLNPVNVTIAEPLMMGFLVTHGIALIATIWMYSAYLMEKRMINMERKENE